jgi:hypothetical protein
VEQGIMAIARKFGGKVYKWHVPNLLAAAEGLPVRETTTDSFDLNVDAWFGEACPPTIANVVAHMKRIRSADLNEPILLSAEGHVFDGLHRLAKCRLEGVEFIKYRQFDVNPDPFEIIEFGEFEREKPLIAATLEWMEENRL